MCAWSTKVALSQITGSDPKVSPTERRDVFGVSLATSNHGFRFAVSYPGKKLGNFSIALGVSPWAIVQ